MTSDRLVRRLTVAAGGTAVIALVGLTAACGNNGEKAPETPTSTTTTTTTTAPSSAPAMTPAPGVTPSEKSLDPNGGSMFTPNIHATQQYTPYPGHH